MRCKTVYTRDCVRLMSQVVCLAWANLAERVQAVRSEGVYANGSVTVRPLPEEVHGPNAERIAPLRRLEGGPVSQQDLEEYLAKEMLKVRAWGFDELSVYIWKPEDCSRPVQVACIVGVPAIGELREGVF